MALIGLLQVAFQVMDYFFDRDPAKIDWSIGLTTAVVSLAGVLLLCWLRREK